MLSDGSVFRLLRTARAAGAGHNSESCGSAPGPQLFRCDEETEDGTQSPISGQTNAETNSTARLTQTRRRAMIVIR